MAAQPKRPAQATPGTRTRCHSVPIRRARTATPRCRIRRASRGQMLKGLTTATGDQAFELCLLASCLSAAEEYLADVAGRRLDRTAALCGGDLRPSSPSGHIMPIRVLHGRPASRPGLARISADIARQLSSTTATESDAQRPLEADAPLGRLVNDRQRGRTERRYAPAPRGIGARQRGLAGRGSFFRPRQCSLPVTATANPA